MLARTHLYVNYKIRLHVHCMFYTVDGMKHRILPQRPDGQEYMVLRQIGTQASRAQLELGLSPPRAGVLELQFQRRRTRHPGDSQLPKFARDEGHVRAVMALGGFWALSERAVGPGLWAVCLPMIGPLAIEEARP